MPTIARALTLLVLAAFAASPLQAQKKARRDPTKIPQEELAEYGDANMYEVIPRARPDFLHPLNLSPGDRMVTGVQGVLIYVESQQLGDETALRYYRASDIKEVRYYKPTDAASPHLSGGAYVIQLIRKDLSTKP